MDKAAGAWVFQGTSDSIGKSRWRGILSQTKVLKVEEYCMYFPLLELHGWGKRPGIRPKTIDSEVPFVCYFSFA